MATEADNVNTGALATIVVVGSLAVLGIALAVTALVRSEEELEGAQKGAVANVEALTKLQAEQRGLLANIDETMQQTADLFQKNPWAATPAAEKQDAGAETADAGDAGDAREGDAEADADGELTAREKGELEREEDRVGQPSGPGGVTPEEIAETIPKGEQKRPAPKPGGGDGPKPGGGDAPPPAPEGDAP